MQQSKEESADKTRPIGERGETGGREMDETEERAKEGTNLIEMIDIDRIRDPKQQHHNLVPSTSRGIPHRRTLILNRIKERGRATCMRQKKKGREIQRERERDKHDGKTELH